jgi:hypothetical protein
LVGELSVSADPMDQVLAELSAESRALLELSMRRGIPDDEIASLLGTTESGVRVRREAVMHEVADSLGEKPDDELRASMAEHLGGRGNLFALPPEDNGSAPERRKSRGRLVPALIGGIVIAATVAVILALSGGSDEPKPRRTAQLGPAAQMEPLPGMPRADGTARLVQRDGRDRLELKVKGLPKRRGAYGVWLYSSVTMARQIGKFPTGTFELDAPLPADFDSFSDVDISLEPDDGNHNHSGDSYLRVPLARLRP